MKTHHRLAAVLMLALTTSCTAVVTAAPEGGKGATPAAPTSLLERGRYLVRIAGCNDCHTAGYAQSGGKVPEAEWLTGDTVGWRGPWGTTYPINLRLYMDAMSERQWLRRAKTMQTRPPMPWWVLNQMSEEDVRAIYHYIRSLGAKGEHVPAFLPPGQEPATPYHILHAQTASSAP